METRIRKYIKRPIPIHAFQWNADLSTLRENIPKQDLKYFRDYCGHDGTILIQTMEGVEKCGPGNYIIRGINGEYYPCDYRIFKKSYKRVK